MTTDSDLDYWMARSYQAEKERDDAMITAERMTSYARKAEARLKAVQDLLHDADRGHRPVIETWDLRDALDGHTRKV